MYECIMYYFTNTVSGQLVIAPKVLNNYEKIGNLIAMGKNDALCFTAVFIALQTITKNPPTCKSKIIIKDTF